MDNATVRMLDVYAFRLRARIDHCMKQGLQSVSMGASFAAELEHALTMAHDWINRTGPYAAAATSASTGKPACEHCNGTGQIFGHADNCDDDLCALNGDQHSCAGKMEPCSCSAPTAPDIPPGCEMARGWAVEVSAQGERVLLLSDVGYSGLADIEPWASTIRGCAEHLQAFIGPAGGSPELAPEPESLETREAAAREPHPCASGCRYALNGEGLAPQCFVGCRKAAKEGIKG